MLISSFQWLVSVYLLFLYLIGILYIKKNRSVLLFNIRKNNIFIENVLVKDTYQQIIYDINLSKVLNSVIFWLGMI